MPALPEKLVSAPLVDSREVDGAPNGGQHPDFVSSTDPIAKPSSPEDNMHIQSEDVELDVDSGVAGNLPVLPALEFRAKLPLESAAQKVYSKEHEDSTGTKWRLMWYPRGNHENNQMTGSSPLFCSLYLEMMTPPEDQQHLRKEVEFVLGMVHQQDTSQNLEKNVEVHAFTKWETDWGFKQFVCVEDLRRKDTGFLVHGAESPPPDSQEKTDQTQTQTQTHKEPEKDKDNGKEAISPQYIEIYARLQYLRQTALPPASLLTNAAYWSSNTGALNGADNGGGGGGGYYPNGQGPPLHVNGIEYDSKEETGMVGLKNQGATCYMNSLLQTLFHIPYFRRAVYQTDTTKEDSVQSVCLALQRVFYRLQTFEASVSTKELTKSFGWGHLDSFMQHDVQELYRILCDRLEQKLKNCDVMHEVHAMQKKKGVEEQNVIQYLFEGEVRSFISCLNVDYTSFRDEKFYDIQLDVKGCKDLKSSFAKYVEVEILDKENQYEAEGFGKQDAKKGLTFRSFPPVLNIHLKRFEYDPMRDGMVKVHDRFEFPEVLELDEMIDDEKDNQAVKNTYHLHSVLVHSGDVHGGHYYVFIRPSPDSASNDWYKFDDDRITKVTKECAINGNYGSSGEGTGTGTGTIESNMADVHETTTTAQDDNLRNVYGKRLRSTSDVAENEEGNGNGPAFSFSSAYMLVYIRCGEYPTLMKTVDVAEIPKALVNRFQEEEEEAIRHKKELQEEHLYMNVRIATDIHIQNFKNVNKNNDFVNFNETLKFKVRRQSFIFELYYVVARKLARIVEKKRRIKGSKQQGKKCSEESSKTDKAETMQRILLIASSLLGRMRFWQVITRENKTIRPDTPIDAKQATSHVDALYEEYRGKGGLYLYLQIMNEEDVDGVQPLKISEIETDSAEFDRATNGTVDRKKLPEIFCWDEDDPLLNEHAMSAPLQTDDETVALIEKSDEEHVSEEDLEKLLYGLPFPVVAVNDILIFIKEYNFTQKQLDKRLTYIGNLVINASCTGKDVLDIVAMHRKKNGKSTGSERKEKLLLFEEIQPMMVQEVDLSMSLAKSELQNGDILCYQLDPEYTSSGTSDLENAMDISQKNVERGDDGATVVDRAAPHTLTTTNIKYPRVPEYFSYLLNRCEVTFYSLEEEKELSERPEDKQSSKSLGFQLPLLYGDSYMDVVQAVAEHLGVPDPLFLRLYTHSTVTGRPKGTPLSYKTRNNDRSTLEDYLTDYTDRTSVLYYEVLEHSIVEIEAKKVVKVSLSMYNNIHRMKEGELAIESNECDDDKKVVKKMKVQRDGIVDTSPTKTDVHPSPAKQDSTTEIQSQSTVERDEPMAENSVSQLYPKTLGNGLVIRSTANLSYLLSPEQSVNDLLQLIQSDLDEERNIETGYRLCELSSSKFSIERVFSSYDFIQELPDQYQSNHWENDSLQSLLLELVPEEETAALSRLKKEIAEDEHIQSKEEEEKRLCDLWKYISISHFQYPSSGSSTWIHEHSVPFVTYVVQGETFGDLRKRIQQRMGISEETMSKWRLCYVKNLVAERIESEPTDCNDVVIFEDEKFMNAASSAPSNLISIGLEYPDPKPLASRYGRRQEHGIKIRQN